MIEREQKSCEECGKIFLPKVHNSIYCGPECRRLATNKKVLAKYHVNKKRKDNKSKRICAVEGCDTILSRYNSEDRCEWHRDLALIDRLVSWGWDEESLRAEWREKT